MVYFDLCCEQKYLIIYAVLNNREQKRIVGDNNTVKILFIYEDLKQKICFDFVDKFPQVSVLTFGKILCVRNTFLTKTIQVIIH